jgi:two-component system NtrC family sensor kinase
MLRDGHSLGAIVVARSPAGPFPAQQIELRQTFADQAVIAIEDVRLFQELEARNRELTSSASSSSGRPRPRCQCRTAAS